MMLTRDGLQTATWQYARLNDTAVFANASMWGDLMDFEP